MLNWIVWNGTVFDIKTVLTKTKQIVIYRTVLPCVNKISRIRIVWKNWIVWNRNVFDN